MSRVKKFIKKGGTALIDQAMLSLTNLLIALVLIKFASKEEYAIYILLFTPILLAMGVQNALLNSPFTTLYGQSSDTQKKDYSLSLFYGHVILGLILFFVSFISLTIYSFWQFESVDLFLVISFSLSVLGVLTREAARAYFYSRKEIQRAFSGDLWYVLLTLSSIAILIWNNDTIKASFILLIMGLSGILPSLYQYTLVHSRIKNVNKTSLLEFWKLGKWALQGVVLTWINLNSYPYFTAIIFSIATVADIAASRLFWMPIALIMASWSTIFRPYIVEWFSQKDFHKMKKISHTSISFGILVFIIYFSLVLILYPFIEKYFLNESYENLILLIGLWGTFFLVQFIRTVFMANLMVNESGYKKLSVIAWIGLLTISILLPILFFKPFPISSIIILLIIAELVQVTFIYLNLKHFWSCSSQQKSLRRGR